ncbi:MAG: helix-turn-helix domain-containing protein [Pseudomonadota bacterium]
MNHQDVISHSSMLPVFENRMVGEVDVWIAACSGIFDVAPIKKGDSQNTFRVSSWFVDPITISNSRYTGMVARRGKWHVEEAGNQIHVHRYAMGRAAVETAGLPIQCDTGAITLLDYARPFNSIHSANDCESFFVPHAAINYRPSDAPHAPVYSASSSMGRLIGREMDDLLSQLRTGAKSVAADDIQRFLGCIEVAMSPETASETARSQARASLKRAIQAFIESRLGTGEICATCILQNFGVSRASLYRMFEAEDGVRTYINRRRLFRAVADLAKAPHQRGHIHKVCERWGFTSDASFNRMVKQNFGQTPGALFEMPIGRFRSDLPDSHVSRLMKQAANRELALT